MEVGCQRICSIISFFDRNYYVIFLGSSYELCDNEVAGQVPLRKGNIIIPKNKKHKEPSHFPAPWANNLKPG